MDEAQAFTCTTAGGGETGFICDSDEAFQEAVANIGSISHEVCRKDAVWHWDRMRAAKQYLELYGRLQDEDRRNQQ